MKFYIQYWAVVIGIMICGALFGCAHTRVSNINYIQQTIAICGSEFANQNDLYIEAAKKCNNLQLLACWETVIGESFVQTSKNFAFSVQNYEHCCAFRFSECLQR